MNAVEKARGDQPLFRFADKDAREMQLVSATGSTRELVRSFQFDLCASDALSQGNFFRASGALALMDAVVDGYVATIFAYGQTGSGKTYSMSGIDELLTNAHKKAVEDPVSFVRHSGDLSDGIIPRALKYLYRTFESAPTDVTFVVRASYCEIYNEQVFDLLNPASGALNVRWNDRSGFYVQQLLVVQCDGVDDVLAVVTEGHRNRRVGTHDMNKDSSRSHSILTVHVDRQTTDPTDSHVSTTFGKVSFVDLAGSERLKETKSTNPEETSNINRSLLTLGKVISALASKAQANFIPYRDSKLTQLLMDSLGGNSLTLMVACVSPSTAALDDTLSTLNYATRAKNITNRPTVQVDPNERALSTLRKENQELKAENETLRMRLKAIGGSGGTISSTSLRASPSKGALTALVRTPSLTLPPLGSSWSPGKDRRAGAHGSVDAAKNQLLTLQEENEKLVHHATARELQIRQLQAANHALERQVRQLLAESSSGPGPTRSSPTGATSPSKPTGGHTGSAVEQLRQQVQHLQQREQELMQALVRGSSDGSRGLTTNGYICVTPPHGVLTATTVLGTTKSRDSRRQLVALHCDKPVVAHRTRIHAWTWSEHSEGRQSRPEEPAFCIVKKTTSKRIPSFPSLFDVQVR